MQLTVNAGLLAAAAAWANEPVQARNTIPILSNLRLRAQDGALCMTGTDLDLEVRATIPAMDVTDGATTVPAAMLRNIAAKLPASAEVALRVDSKDMVITSGRRKARLATLPAADFPDLAAARPVAEFSLAAAQAATLFGVPAFAISTEETRYYLNGIYLHPVATGAHAGLNAVATDGYRLAHTWVAITPPEFAGVIVPRMAVTAINKITAKAKEIAVAVGETKIACTASIGEIDVVMTSKVIDGTFPDYHRVIPKGNALTATVDREALVKAAEFAGLVAPERGRGVKLSFDGTDMSVAARGAEFGQADESLPFDPGESGLGKKAPKGPFEIGVNGRYLTDIATAAGGERVTLHLADSGSPVLVTADGKGDRQFVLMPLRI